MKRLRRLVQQLHLPASALALMSLAQLPAQAQDAHSHSQAQQNAELTADQRSQARTLLKKVRDATERFQNVQVAEADGYQLLFGCVSGDSVGAMGLHYVNMDLVSKGEVKLNHPQIVIYEPTSDGRVRLTGADYLILAEGWDKNHPGDPPQLMGQLFHLFDAPNRFGLPAFYTLHVWAWKDNPNGAFVNWHPNVSCESFTGTDPRR
ncbi:MAG TPA: hypothetical protein VK652_11775 [Steroidobacteraceae bacterium]|nr:hypothetical protein [Steroidobacteraceae bacterium]